MEEKKHCKWYNDEFCTNDKSPCVADYCPVVEYPELCKCRELDNGENLANVANSLANEEVIRGLENWISHYCTAKPQDLTNALDLIQRLQGDYSNLKERYVKVLSLNEKVIAEQKAEIERLSFYKNVFDKGLAVSLVNMQETIDMQKAEIERLTEERDGNKFNSGKYNRALESLSKERRLNAELQKGVKTHNYTATFNALEADRWQQGYAQGKKETAEKFAEKLKELVADFDELRCMQVFEFIDEICKEIIGEENGN